MFPAERTSYFARPVVQLSRFLLRPSCAAGISVTHLAVCLLILFGPPLASGQELVEFKGHEEVVYDAKFLPDGKSLVTASFDQTLKLWNVGSQTVLRTMEGHTGIVLTVAVSPDGRQIASGSSDRSIRLWDVPNSDPVSTTRVHENPVTAMATSKNGALTATGDSKGTVRIWTTGNDAASAESAGLTPPKPTQEVSIGRPISRLAWRNDNQKLAVACTDGSVVIVSLSPNSDPVDGQLGAHDGEVTGVVFSPNNQVMLTCGADGYVRRWPTTIPSTLEFDGLPKAATSLAIHPSGSLIVIVGEDGSAKILKRADGSVVHTLEGHSGTVNGVAFNRAGSQLATICADNIVRVFDVSSGKVLHETTPAKSPLTSVMFSADGKDIIVGSERGDVLAYALAEPFRFRSLSKRPEAVRAMATTSNGSLIAYAGDGRQLWIRDSTNEKTTKAADFDAAVTAVAISANNSTIAVGLATGGVATFNATDFKPVGQLVGHVSPVQRLVFNTTGTHLVSAAADGIVRLWDLKAEAIAQSFSGSDSPIKDVAFQSDNKSIVTVHVDGKVRVETFTAQLVHRADDRRVNDLSLASNGSQYATAGADGIVKLWNASNSSPTRSFSGFEGPALCVCLSPDNRQIAAGGSDKTIHTWNVSNSAGHFRFDVPTAPHRVEYSPDSTRLITALTDGTLQCFDPTPLNPQPAEPPGRDASQILIGHAGNVADISWTPDSQTLRTSGADMTLREWSIASPKEKATLNGHSLQIYSVVYSPDGETLASASADKTVRLWDLATGKAIRTLATFAAPVYGLTFSSDGKQIAIAGADNSVRLLDASNGREIRQFTGPQHPIYSVGFSPDDQKIAAAGMGLGSARNVYLWSVDSSEPAAVLSGHDDDIYRTQFNSAGTRLLTVGYSGSLKIWDLVSSQPIFAKNLGVVSYSGSLSPDGSRVVVTSNDRTARLLEIPETAR
jgi:WD40 repeat protein